MANEEQLSILRRGVDVWNKWRKDHPNAEIELNDADLGEVKLAGINLSKVKLIRANFYKADLGKANLRRANLRKVNLFKANLMEADLSKSSLRDANLGETNLSKANLFEAILDEAELRKANLEKADLTGASLIGTRIGLANLRGANLSDANLSYANLNQTNLSEANLCSTNLSQANFVSTRINMAKISGSTVYGINVWDLKGEFKEQKDLIVTPHNQSVVTVDNIEVAQFIYLLLNNQKIRNVIDTVTTKTVLILGRFTEERKQILDTLRDALRERGFIPILFDFQPSLQRDLTETIQLLANMAKFIIADITDAKSIPQELSHIIPFLPSVPVQPILLMSSQEYGMFEHWRGFNSVLPEFLYKDGQHLIDNMEAKLIIPINAWHKNQDKVSVLEKQIKELQEKLSKNEREK